jgi:hypothetical protein
MIRNTFIAVAFGLAVMAGAAPAAKADVDININLGFGGFYGNNISCRQGERIVERRFNQVVPRNCRGSHYKYTGRRNGKWFIITISSRSGRITDVQRWRR